MKKQLILLLALLLVGCKTNNPTSDSTLIPSESNTNSQVLTFEPFTYKTRVSEYDFTYLTKGLTNNYSNQLIKAEEKSYFVDESLIENNFTLIKFDNVSTQNAFPGYPVINAFDNKHETKYVDILSPSTFDIHEVTLNLSIWNKGDLSNVPSDYYLGLEYLKDGEWISLKSLDVLDLSVGIIDEPSFSFNIEETGIRNIRFAFDFSNATNNVRFVLSSMNLKGNQLVINDNPDISNITLESNQLMLEENKSLTINPIVISSSATNLVEYHSSDRSVAIVNEEGVVKALSVGEAVITVKNANISASLTITVTKENQNYEKAIQNIVSFVGEIPSGFTSNFETYFSGAQLNFKEEGNYVLTPTYQNITGETVVILNMKLTSTAEIDLSKENIFAVQGINSDGDIVESVKKTNLINTDFEDVEFKFKSTEIVKYKIIFEYKHSVNMGNYSKTGKNYCLNSLMIYQK